MGIFEHFPYTNYQNFNDDWILKTVQELKTALDGDFSAYIEKWVLENYNQLFFNAAYNSGTDTLTMSLAESIAAAAGGEPVSYIDLAGRVLEIADKSARSELAKISPTVDALEKSYINSFNRCVFIGDSWLVGENLPNGEQDTFAWKFCELMGVQNPEIIAAGGIGFAATGSGGQGNAATYFNSQKRTISDPETVTMVVVCLGLNDRFSDANSIRNGATSLFSEIKDYFVNAKVFYMPNPNYSPVSREKILYKMPQTCAGSGVSYIDSYWWCLFDNDLFMNDKFHPSIAGNSFIAGCLKTSLTGGSVYHGTQFTFSGATNFYIVVDRDTVMFYGTPSISSTAETTLWTWDANWFKGAGNLTAPRLGWRRSIQIGNGGASQATIQFEPSNNNAVLKNGQTSGGTYFSGSTRVAFDFNAAMLFG